MTEGWAGEEMEEGRGGGGEQWKAEEGARGYWEQRKVWGRGGRGGWGKREAEGATVQGRPSTVASLKGSPTVKVTLVVRMEVEVRMDMVSPFWVISTEGLEAAATASFRSTMLTPADQKRIQTHSSALQP